MKKVILLSAIFLMSFASAAMCAPVIPADTINPYVQVTLACVVAAGIMIKMFSHYKGNKSNVISNNGYRTVTNGGFEDVLDELSGDFDKMNFDGSMKDGDQRHFNKKVMQLTNYLKNNGGFTGAGRSSVGAIGSSATIEGLISSSVGDLNISITRVSANIAEPLPFVLFGLNQFSSTYSAVIKPFLSSGCTFAVSTDADGNVIYTYVKGGQTDTVKVSFSGLTNYRDFLQSMNQNFFKTKYIMYSVDDVANANAQFRQMLNFGLASALGAKAANQLNINSRKMTWDFQSDRVNILLPEQKVTADFNFVQSIINVAGHVINMDVYMSEKANMNNIAV